LFLAAADALAGLSGSNSKHWRDQPILRHQVLVALALFSLRSLTDFAARFPETLATDWHEESIDIALYLIVIFRTAFGPTEVDRGEQYAAAVYPRDDMRSS
jgi:hypothetical protein